MIQIYDSLSQKNKQIDEKEPVYMYACGPTVYNDIHIGNLRQTINFDIMYRYLKLRGLKVTFVHNLTDVDDKIINRAEEENVSEKEISEKYSLAYTDLLKLINFSEITFDEKERENKVLIVKVTEHIDDIINYVKRILDTNSAYIGANGDVYFSIDSVKDIYGQLSKQNIDMLKNDARKEIDSEQKKNPLDFVLWKKTSHGVNWKTEWNDHGRPGWHTECACFIDMYFKDKCTIHGGGIDLKFPHHENERAQHWSLYKDEMAKIWAHGGHLNVNSVKMSKSLGNFILAKDAVKQYGANTLRWFFLQTSFESPVDYREDVLKECGTQLNKIFLKILTALVTLELENKEFKISNKANMDEFNKIFDNDLNFPNAVAYLLSLTNELQGDSNNKKIESLQEKLSIIHNIFQVFGIKYDFSLTEKQKELAKTWKEKLSNKQYDEADKARKELFYI